MAQPLETRWHRRLAEPQRTLATWERYSTILTTESASSPLGMAGDHTQVSALRQIHLRNVPPYRPCRLGGHQCGLHNTRA